MISASNLSVDIDIEIKQHFIEDLITECKKVPQENPGNRCAKFCEQYLSTKEGKSLDGQGKCEQGTVINVGILLNQ